MALNGRALWCWWRFVFTLVICTWSLAIGANYLSTKGDFEILKAAAGDAFGNSNWCHIASIITVVSGSAVAAALFFAVGYDQASWQSTTRPLTQLARVIVGFGSEMATLGIVAVSSIYLYEHDGSVQQDLSGAPWVVTLGAVFFAMVLIDRVFFTPSLAYIEFMASPIINMCSRNAVMCDGRMVRETGAYSMYFRRLYPQLPKLHVLYGSDAQIHGIPIVDLMHARPAVGHREVYQAAARELVRRMCSQYGLSDEQIDV